jgi:hypothetical protein
MAAGDRATFHTGFRRDGAAEGKLHIAVMAT